MKFALFLICSLALAQDTKQEPVVLTPEQVREHIKMQREEQLAQQLLMLEMSNIIGRQNAVIEALRKSTNCL